MTDRPPGPLNPPPERLPADPDIVRVRFTHCNACERPFADGDEAWVQAAVDDDGTLGGTRTIAVHVPACPDPPDPAPSSPM